MVCSLKMSIKSHCLFQENSQMKNVTGQHLTLLFQYILHPVSPGHLSSQCKHILLFRSFAYERILKKIFLSFYKTNIPESIKRNDAKCILSFKKPWTDVHGYVSWHFLISSQKTFLLLLRLLVKCPWKITACRTIPQPLPRTMQ